MYKTITGKFEVIYVVCVLILLDRSAYPSKYRALVLLGHYAPLGNAEMVARMVRLVYSLVMREWDILFHTFTIFTFVGILYFL